MLMANREERTTFASLYVNPKINKLIEFVFLTLNAQSPVIEGHYLSGIPRFRGH